MTTTTATSECRAQLNPKNKCLQMVYYTAIIASLPTTSTNKSAQLLSMANH